MSVEIAWERITSGADGAALADTIRDFIHDKFQQITLPRFISAVHVHSFDFGSICPNIEIKDICDPLPDFYEDEEDNQTYSTEAFPTSLDASTELRKSGLNVHESTDEFRPDGLQDRVAALQYFDNGVAGQAAPFSAQTSASHARVSRQNTLDTSAGSFARGGTPGIPGGTSNMNYFHFPISGLSGAQTPLAAVAGGGPFATHAWLRDQQARYGEVAGLRMGSQNSDVHHESSSTRPRTTGSISSPELGSPLHPSSPERHPVGYLSAEKVSDDISSSNLLAPPTLPSAEQVSPSDLQVVARVTYKGDVQMMLTAEIMLDYPMPSFVKIPLKLSIAGLTFDGVAILAYIRKKMHFCFLDPEDANTLVGDSISHDDLSTEYFPNPKRTIGSLLREIQVETEIGRQESGKQVLKNVGKVERFVLEQVRKIFEEEFVFPSFWTFLV